MYQTFYRGSEFLSYPLFALGVFFVFFVGTVVWAYRPRNQRRFDADAQLPLAEGRHDND